MSICNCSIDTIIPCPYHKAGYKLFDESQMIETEIYNTTVILICPDCQNHEQDLSTIYHDCKNLYWTGKYGEDGKKIMGQCGCYSEAHGKSD